MSLADAFDSMNWPRRRRTKWPSKRRWKARYRMGRIIPHQIVEEFPGLRKIMSDRDFLPHVDAWQRKSNG